MILTRRRLGEIDEQRIDWWPEVRLPAAGEHIISPSGGLGGFVEYVSWDLAANALRVYLR